MHVDCAGHHAPIGQRIPFLLKTRSAGMPVALFKLRAQRCAVLLELRVGRAEHVEGAA